MLIIGIAGGTGSGKTTVVHQIMNELPHTEVGIISQDSYYKESTNPIYEERAKTNFDHPRAIDFDLIVAEGAVVCKHCEQDASSAAEGASSTA